MWQHYLALLDANHYKVIKTRLWCCFHWSGLWICICEMLLNVQTTCVSTTFQRLQLLLTADFQKSPTWDKKALLPLFMKGLEKRCIVSTEAGGGSDLWLVAACFLFASRWNRQKLSAPDTLPPERSPRPRGQEPGGSGGSAAGWPRSSCWTDSLGCLCSFTWSKLLSVVTSPEKFWTSTGSPTVTSTDADI